MNWYIVCLSVSFQYKGICFDSGGFIGSGVLNTAPPPLSAQALFGQALTFYRSWQIWNWYFEVMFSIVDIALNFHDYFDY